MGWLTWLGTRNKACLATTVMGLESIKFWDFVKWLSKGHSDVCSRFVMVHVSVNRATDISKLRLWQSNQYEHEDRPFLFWVYREAI
jgi:hypothetical protein